jgi:hypothetical protein
MNYITYNEYTPGIELYQIQNDKHEREVTVQSHPITTWGEH